MKKRGQQAVGMGFGMIFAIFLIIVFVIVAFVVIKSFLNIGTAAQIGMFYDDLQEAVNKAVRSQESNSVFEIDLPSGIEKVCFANLSARITNQGAEYEQIKNYDVYEANLFLVPPEKTENMQWKLIDRLDISAITKGKNPYCVDADVSLRIKKGFYDRAVVIE